MGHTKPAVEVVPRYKVGEVVVTRKSVVCLVRGRDRPDGRADPGWRWLIVAVGIENRGVRYEVVAESAPKMYHQVLRESQIMKVVERRVIK
jgi:hypothetical protein